MERRGRILLVFVPPSLPPLLRFLEASALSLILAGESVEALIEASASGAEL